MRQKYSLIRIEKKKKKKKKKKKNKKKSEELSDFDNNLPKFLKYYLPENNS